MTDSKTIEIHKADAELESLIDQAGRYEVFDRAIAAGWTPWNPPPRWVWVQLSNEILALEAHEKTQA